MRRGRLGPSGLALAAVLACFPGASAGNDAAPGSGTVVYLVSHGWHVGLVLRRDDLAAVNPTPALPVPATEHVEIGWGDGDFYPAQHGTVSLALRAAFCSRFSVMQVAGFD